jgi:hypothetical protein
MAGVQARDSYPKGCSGITRSKVIKLLRTEHKMSVAYLSSGIWRRVGLLQADVSEERVLHLQGRSNKASV